MQLANCTGPLRFLLREVLRSAPCKRCRSPGKLTASRLGRHAWKQASRAPQIQQALQPQFKLPHAAGVGAASDRKSTRLNSSHVAISYAVFCLKKKKKKEYTRPMYN